MASSLNASGDSRHCLIIGKVWPEPSSTAAGRRTQDLIMALQEAGWRVSFASAAQQGTHAVSLEDIDVQAHTIRVNDSNFGTWFAELAPDAVVFDRFMTEEQFGWRVAQQCPGTLRVLDTSDLHCLRIAREQSLKNALPINLQNDTALREIASIYRSDLTLMISDFEMRILRDHFMISEPLVAYWPFTMDASESPFPNYESRQHCIMIGSFMHPPNLDAARWCKREIWPLVRQCLADVELHCYGSYGDKYAAELHAPKQGFHFMGRAEDALLTIEKYRLNMASLRYGAGLKGKVFDGFATGTPTILSPIAAEGIIEPDGWSDLISDDPQAIADVIVELHTDSEKWNSYQRKQQEVASIRFNSKDWVPKLADIFNEALEQIDERRKANFIGQMFNHHYQRSTEFMSRWIEAKNR